MLILGIESSCDDTAAAIIDSHKTILSSIVLSQNKEHELFRGVVPEIAARAHMQNLERALTDALTQAKVSIQNIDAVAATSGPGLIGGVIVGSVFGRTLASVLSKPFIAVNHLEAHALTVRLTNNISYPYLLLLVSGGHCQFVAVKGLGQYKILGQTLDDAVGEAFDKVAKMLNLGFPGGPIIERIAAFGDHKKYILPKPLINQDGCNMSFSGLKTAISLLIAKLGDLSQQDVYDIAASFQYVVGEVLVSKALKAIKLYEQYLNNDTYYSKPEHYNQNFKKLVLAGGVAANKYLNTTIANAIMEYNYQLMSPPVDLCTDNAAMVAYVGLERLLSGKVNDINFCPRARWSLEELTI